MSGQGSSPDESFSNVAAGCSLRETRESNNNDNASLREASAAPAPAAGIPSSGEQQQRRHSSSERQPNDCAAGSGVAERESSGGISSSSEHAADFFHNYYSNRGHALDSNEVSFSSETGISSSDPLKSLKSSAPVYGELTVYSWGRGEDGQLGIGDTSDQDVPTYVDALRGVGVKEIACGSGHTVVLTGEGEVYTW